MQPAQPLTSIAERFKRVREVVIERFPHLWLPTLACLSNVAALSYEVSFCPSIILLGPSGSGKTTVLDFFSASGETVRVDKFTPASFVSNYSAKSEEELRKSDLLPKLRDRILLTRDLATLFRGEQVRLDETFATLTGILDGDGHMTASGIHGTRGYIDGKYVFAWLGGTPKVNKDAWELMAQVGSRLFFLQMPEPAVPVDMFTAEKPYEQLRAECRMEVSELIDHVRGRVAARSLTWNPNETAPLHRQALTVFAQVVAHGRGYVDDEDVGHPESPHRASQGLVAMSYGHALLNGRFAVDDEDLVVPLHVATSSMPEDRSRLVRELLNSARISRAAGVEAASKSRPTIAGAFKEMEALKLGTRVHDAHNFTAPEYLTRSELTHQLWLHAEIVEAQLPTGIPQLHRLPAIAEKGTLPAA